MNKFNFFICLALTTFLATPCMADASFDRSAAHKSVQSKNLCKKEDRVVFSCELEGNKKIVSMCVSGDVRQNQNRFYYSYGKASKPELIFPSAAQSSQDAFSRTHLNFTGNTGGYAYSFKNNDYKYIIYSISGDRRYSDAGLIVQHAGNQRITQKLRCQKSSIFDSDDNDILDATLKWRNDPDIESHGLPDKR